MHVTQVQLSQIIFCLLVPPLACMWPRCNLVRLYFELCFSTYVCVLLFEAASQLIRRVFLWTSRSNGIILHALLSNHFNHHTFPTMLARALTLEIEGSEIWMAMAMCLSESPLLWNDGCLERWLGFVREPLKAIVRIWFVTHITQIWRKIWATTDRPGPSIQFASCSV